MPSGLSRFDLYCMFAPLTKQDTGDVFVHIGVTADITKCFASVQRGLPLPITLVMRHDFGSYLVANKARDLLCKLLVTRKAEAGAGWFRLDTGDKRHSTLFQSASAEVLGDYKRWRVTDVEKGRAVACATE